MLLVARKDARHWRREPHRKLRIYLVARRKKVKPRQIFWKLKMLSAMIACTLAALALISFSVSVVNTVRQVEQAEAELQALLEESRQLQLQIASLRTPGRLEEEAYKLGMQYPGKEQIIILTARAANE